MRIKKEKLDQIDRSISNGEQRGLTAASQMIYVKVIALCLRELVAREYAEGS